MKIKILLAGLAFFIMTTAAQAEFDLKDNMLKLNAELWEVQQGFITNNKEGVKDAIKRFSKDAHDLLSNKSKIEKMLPEGKRHKANMAVNAARKIAKNIQIIEDAIENKRNEPMLKRQEDAQRAYTYIELACFHCHNLVRDQD